MTQRGKGKPKTRNTVANPDPSPRDLEIYRELCKGRTIRNVGEEYQLSHPVILDIRDKVRLWLAPRIQKEIIAIKVDQTQSLEHIFQESMAGWERSKNPTVTKKTTDAGKFPGDTEITKTTSGEVSFLSQAQSALADIRKVWNIEKHYDHLGQDSMRAAGMKREEFQIKIAQSQISELQELVKELRGQGAVNE